MDRATEETVARIAALGERFTAETMAAHPAFRVVVHDYTADVLATRRGERVLNKLLAQRERELIGFLILCQHYEAGAGGSPPTLARLASSGLGSPRRITGFIQLLRLAGLVRHATDPADRRRRILVPTARFIALHRGWTLAALRQLDRLLETPLLEAVFHRHPDFHALACRLGAPELFRGETFALGRYPLVDFLTPRRGGHLIAASLAQACFAGGRRVHPVTLPYGRIARRIGVSRSHVMNVFMDAEASGLLTCLDAGRAITLSPQSEQDLLHYFAHELAFIARHALAAARILASPEA